MKANKLVGITLLSTMILGSTLSSVSAAEVEQTITKTGSVEFIPDDSPVPPVDPENPDPEIPEIPVDPETEVPEVIDPNPGPLSLDYASALYFGKNKISGKTEIYSAKAQQFDREGKLESVPNYAQVTDKRGNLAGWTLSVKQDDVFKTASGEQLTGAQIDFTNAVSATIAEKKELSYVASDVSLVVGESIKAMQASKGQGAGTFTYYMGSSEGLVEGEQYIQNDSVTLTVPGSSTKLAERYATTLTWTLTDVPGEVAGQ